MKAKIKEKKGVQYLRRQGLSYKEILKKVPVAKSSISLWCQDIGLTLEQKKRLIKKQQENLKRLAKIGPRAAVLKRQKEIYKIKKAAKKEIYPLSLYEFKIVGAMIYWAEGNKNQKAEITNSDPRLVRFMVRWLKEVCKVPPERLRARLNIHSDQNNEKIKRYWSKVTGVPIGQFGKSYIKPEGTGHRKNILHNGVIRIGISSEDLRHRIMTWIKALTQYQL